MSAKPLVTMPKPLTNVLDTYFQTSRYAQKNFLPFKKEMVLGQLHDVAAKYGYTVITGTENGADFKGVFKLERPSQKLRVSAKTLPKAEKWA